MKYSDFLKRVRLHLVHPAHDLLTVDGRWAAVPDEQATALCGAVERATDALLRHADRAMAEVYRLGFRATRRVGLSMHWASAPAYYPDGLGIKLGLGDETINSLRWRQTVRHQLLDRMIGEALVEEADHGQDQ